ncbi:hypothetical protein CsatB_010401 [Cannabis sativa]|uniref:uncharacterized protein LOC115708903 n=1 Tax=Cannabis sativa TaxID=3483 RepID=UPI0011DFBD03|nr:uncharacterized protein LOC115708903 [Cannabis sativa]XP_060974389.1 uncharacterized protein LOC133039505 [Cannabis sativa]
MKRVSHPKCSCAQPVVIKTSWTDANPGRRFGMCRRYRLVGGCYFWEWIDPPMCERASEVVPGLLRKIRRLEGEISDISTSNVDAYNYLNSVENNCEQSSILKALNKGVQVDEHSLVNSMGKTACMESFNGSSSTSVEDPKEKICTSGILVISVVVAIVLFWLMF